MKEYIGVKIIKAEPQDCPKDVHQSKIGDEGYKVTYEDGYTSWSPREIFKGAYRPIDDMTFGLAIEAMKKGFKVARKGWNGKNMCIFIQPGHEISYVTQANNRHGLKLGDNIIMRAADGSGVNGWLASQTDMLSEDWQIVE